MLAALCALSISTNVIGQYPGWQQEVSYDMEVVVDTSMHQYSGSMTAVYTNNSPEHLTKVFWHLFFNAFQPGSMMDVRSRSISDPDRRVGSRIVKLPESEWGWQKVATVQVLSLIHI